MDFERILLGAVEHGAADIHMQAGSPPMLRLANQLRALDMPALTDADMLAFLTAITPAHLAGDLEQAVTRGLDFSHALASGIRFRCSAFRTMAHVGITMRIIKNEIPSIEQLKLPAAIHDIALAGRGLTLLTGTTGSGKSTTLACMIDLINSHHRCKIITIEDPVEYIHTNRKALISQMEVGTDTISFDQALRQALRQDPDVILIGELRDLETLHMALRAADTGHQVFATVHSANAAQTIQRIIAMFPPTEHKLLLNQLASHIEAIISQRLIVDVQGKRRPAVEVLRGGPVTQRLILEDRLDELSAFLNTGENGMQSFDQHLLRMQQANEIKGTEALRHASNPESLSIAMRGIRFSGGIA